MESGIALQETEDATQVELLQALWLTFSMAAQIKFVLKEKGPSKQIFPTPRQPDFCASASTVLSVGRPVQQSDPQPSSDQDSGTCCSGQGHFLLHIASAGAEPTHRAASGPFFMMAGQENGFPPTSGLSSQHHVCSLEEPVFGAVKTLSLAYQNHIPSIHQLHLPVRGGTSSHNQQPSAKQGSGPFPSRWSSPTLYYAKDINWREDFYLVWWEGLGAPMSSYPKMYRVWLTKHVLNFGGNDMQQYYWSNGVHLPKCESCGTHTKYTMYIC
jgi:hypothetical protein